MGSRSYLRFYQSSFALRTKPQILSKAHSLALAHTPALFSPLPLTLASATVTQCAVPFPGLTEPLFQTFAPGGLSAPVLPRLFFANSPPILQ